MGRYIRLGNSPVPNHYWMAKGLSPLRVALLAALLHDLSIRLNPGIMAMVSQWSVQPGLGRALLAGQGLKFSLHVKQSLPTGRMYPLRHTKESLLTFSHAQRQLEGADAIVCHLISSLKTGAPRWTRALPTEVHL